MCVHVCLCESKFNSTHIGSDILTKLEKSSFKLIVGVTVRKYGLNLLSTVCWAMNNHPNFDITSVVGSLIWFGFSVYCFLYYYQRKSIFSSAKDIATIKKTQTVTQNDSMTTKQICYCRKCGASIPPDSIFCPCCGEKI